MSSQVVLGIYSISFRGDITDFETRHGGISAFFPVVITALATVLLW